MIATTGATGQLGRLVIASLLKTQPAESLIAVVRSPEKAADLAAKGVAVRQGDYAKPETLAAAFAGVDKLLLISSNEIGQRAPHHAAVIAAAKAAGVKLIAYTSILGGPKSPLALAGEHVTTENALIASGIPYVLLRNGWYNENFTSTIEVANQHKVVLGCSGDGKISAASRADFAAAAAAVLLKDGQAGKVYELAGDTAFTKAELAAAVSAHIEAPVFHKEVPENEYKAVLHSSGLPEAFAGILANSDTGTKAGGLFDDAQALSRLIGRPTTPISATIAAILRK